MAAGIAGLHLLDAGVGIKRLDHAPETTTRKNCCIKTHLKFLLVFCKWALVATIDWPCGLLCALVGLVDDVLGFFGLVGPDDLPLTCNSNAPSPPSSAGVGTVVDRWYQPPSECGWRCR
ncbi:hypothetical protein FD34_GL000372 [Limosilactobacillus pontis DSM 8475]|uniref:Uncharacterized protein n=1 Tax=Limosilactobacillus pontis DSM 8475 TaxID=1423794 RepID=A0A922TI52_9LACO|nr:hypothetical protein FD34_GL000372 [Limosilactobacillus pontis DSM 8475]